MTRLFFMLLTACICNALYAQVTPVTVAYYYPKDSVKFQQDITNMDYHYAKEQYGRTTMFIHCESAIGSFDFIFKKKVHKLSRMISYANGAVGEVFDTVANKWVLEPDSRTPASMTSKPTDTTVYSEHDLFAIIVKHAGNKTEQLSLFKDFGNVVYWPAFDYANCNISDENKDGKPEFYLSYMGNSDGLDTKPYKQIIYTFSAGNNTIVKSKATAYYPAGNEEDKYTEAFDANWKSLPKPVQAKSKGILHRYNTVHKE